MPTVTRIHLASEMNLSSSKIEQGLDTKRSRATKKFALLVVDAKGKKAV